MVIRGDISSFYRKEREKRKRPRKRSTAQHKSAKMVIGGDLTSYGHTWLYLTLNCLSIYK